MLLIQRSPELVTLLFLILVCVSLLLMWDMHRNQSCKECAHCKEKERLQAIREADDAHRGWHLMYDRSDCKDKEKCQGYRKPKS